MKRIVAYLWISVLVVGVALTIAPRHAWTASAEMASPIPPGTIITPQNWRNYKQYMTDGLVGIFAGRWLWKFPSNFQMVVAKTESHPLPPVYVQNTEKYAKSVKIVNLSDGGHNIQGYVAGIPFPNPTDPLKGWKLLVDDWYSYQPYTLCSPHSRFWTRDRLGNISPLEVAWLRRRASHVSDPGIPINPPEGRGMDLVLFTQIRQPEQARYTTLLEIWNADLSKPINSYLFIPALRRSLRLSTAARCSPTFGLDYANDDTRQGAFNGSVPMFDADYLGERQVLESAPRVKNDPRLLYNLANYYQPILFAKPILGSWEVRPVWMINVHRIPSLAKGYCYSKRILYIDKEDYTAQWCDLYDASGRFWKVDLDPQALVEIPGVGKEWVNGGWGFMFDVQTTHESLVSLAFQANQDCKDIDGVDYTNTENYYSLSALARIMR